MAKALYNVTISIEEKGTPVLLIDHSLAIFFLVLSLYLSLVFSQFFLGLAVIKTKIVLPSNHLFLHRAKI